jgi:hypothetical protein
MFTNLPILLAAGHAGANFPRVLTVTLIFTTALIVVHLVWTIARPKRPGPRKRWGIWESLVYIGALGCVLLLALTSFGAMARFGAIGGWALFVHMVGAGMFTTVLPVIALTWAAAHWCCCDCRDKTEMNPCRGDDEAEGHTVGNEPTVGHFFWLAKLCFWTILAAGWVVTMTMLISMLPLFGTDGLNALLNVHRYAGLIVVVALILHLYAVVLRCVGLR